MVKKAKHSARNEHIGNESKHGNGQMFPGSFLILLKWEGGRFLKRLGSYWGSGKDLKEGKVG